MKKVLLTIALIQLSSVLFGQETKDEREVVAEGKKLYRSEMASWYGTDLYVAKFTGKHASTGGYFSYTENDRSICVFFSNSEKPKVLATFSFDSTYNVNTAVIDGADRELTEKESDLITIRQIAKKEMETDTLFRFYQDMNPNLIPLSDEKGKRVYILTGPAKTGVVVFGNDYLLTFNKGNKLKKKKRIHKNIITLDYGADNGKIVIGAMHTHLRETGHIITATDICTLMLYAKYAKWSQHIIISEENVSIWNCDKNQLLVLSRKAWEKMNNDQK